MKFLLIHTVRNTVLLCIIFSVLFLFGCGEKREIVTDGITADLPIESVAKSENENITEGNAYFAGGDFNTAIDYYKDAMKHNKATAFYNIGVCYYLLNNIPQAELNFREAVNADPDFDEAVMNLVAVLAQQEKINEAEKYITRLIHTNKSPRVYVDMANISLKTGDTAKAAYYYKQALDTDSKSPFILSNYANFLISIGEYKDGIDILEKFDTKDFSINYNIANAYRHLDDMSSSLAYAADALYSPGATEEGCNKLAALFYDYKRYNDEARALRMLIALAPKKEYRIRLVMSFINSTDFDKALDELAFLLNDYPNDAELNVLNYETLIFSGRIVDAGSFIRNVYKTLGGDKLLYYYTKHLSLYEKDRSEVSRLIFVKRDSNWLNLARTVYSLKGDKISDARMYLDRVPESVGHEYFYYKTYLLIINKRFREAEAASAKMRQDRPDTFWYRLVILWNLRQPDLMLSLTNTFKDNPAIANIHTPVFKFDVIPVLDDMSFTYRFDDVGTDVAAMLAYPLFLEPDEIVQFLVMGRSTLKDSEKEQATKKLEGMKRNNEGVDAFYEYNFEKAVERFTQAEKFLPGNSAVLYNLGISYFNLGNNKEALETFNKAIAQDKTLGQGYFGSGLVYYRVGDRAMAYSLFDQAINVSASKVENSDKPSIDDVRSVYLSILASSRHNKRNEAELTVKTDDALAVSAAMLMDYFDSYDESLLSAFDNSPVFRVQSIQNLLKMRHGSASAEAVVNNPDRYYTLAAKYIALKMGEESAAYVNPVFAKDKVYLKDMVYTSIFLKDKASGLKYLQSLSKIDYTFQELYKASTYYFTWIRDFVNAEASYGSLDRIGYEDRLTGFYTLLYFLCNFNDARLEQYIGRYNEVFGEDYRSGIAFAMMNLHMKNLNGFYTAIAKVIKDDPYIFNKMFIEVDFAKF
ncbi:MAG: tetratricopeptide repeat protein [Deferribacterales bacterium]|nr:tetratricopeptide repeat protein [Deferribacterales bacterium]